MASIGRRRWIGSWIGVAAGVALCTALHAQQPNDSEAQIGLDRIHDRMRTLFKLAPESRLDADLRAAAQGLIEAELPRIRQLLSAWLDEEQRVRPAASLADRLNAVNLRAHNEMALWQLDSAGPAHDRLRQQAWGQPGSCELPDNPSPLDRVLQVWQQVPREQRADFLAAEAELLHR